MKRLLSVILVVTMVLSLSNFAVAAEKELVFEGISEEEIISARNAYYSLSIEARLIFEKALLLDSDMLRFHITYVDPEFNGGVINTKSCSPGKYVVVKSATTDPMTILNAQLAALSLPTSVIYSLKAMGAGMVAAVADGPLPIGDILLAAATASAVVVIVANWKVVSPKWERIINAFKRAFSSSANNIVDAFSSLKSDIKTEYKVKFDESAEDAVDDCDENKQHHIIDQDKHNWRKLFPNGPKWSGVAPIIVETLKKGQETAEKGGTYLRTLAYKGQFIVVRFKKDDNGLVYKISTAWVK